MKKSFNAQRLLLASMFAVSAAACGDDITNVTNNYGDSDTVATDTDNSGGDNGDGGDGSTELDCTQQVYTTQPTVTAHTSITQKSVITVDGLQFRDLNGNNTLDVYEDWRLPEICRARDLITQMSSDQKIGLMSEGSTMGSGTADGTLSQTTQDNIVVNHLRQALVRFSSITAEQYATYTNNLQELAEAQPLGIPIVLTADPVHAISQSTSADTGTQSLSITSAVSSFPYPMGLGAANDLTLTHEAGDIVRREFMAMGFRWQLGPMADIATEPRWARVQNTFGDNALHVANHVDAYLRGFQGSDDGSLRNGIAATIKHFPGAGANEDGKDSHSASGKYNVFPGDNFEYHQIPFIAAVSAGAAAVMPCYSIFRGQFEWDPYQTGAIYSHGLITDYLKEQIGFDGMVTSDWGTLSGTAWGVEALSQSQRVALFLEAGAHQLGSDGISIIKTAYADGSVGDDEINAAAEKILEMSFKLGIFENPYVDTAAASTEVRSSANRLKGLEAQKKAVVILRNQDHATSGNNVERYLPISGSRYTDANANSAPDAGEYIDDADDDGQIEVFFDGAVDGITSTTSDPYEDVLGAYDYASAASGTTLPVVNAASLATADIAVLRITARKGTYFGLDAGVPLSFDGTFPGASTDSNAAAAIRDRNRVIDAFRARDGYTNWNGDAVVATNPNLKIILVVHMDRPAILRPFVNGLISLDEPSGEGSYPSLQPSNTRTDTTHGVDGILADFGAYDRAILDVLFNANIPTSPTGYVYGRARLPLELPSSDAAVDAQFEDLPSDSASPTYNVGAGSTY